MAKLSKYQILQKKLMSQTTKLFDFNDAKELYTALSNGQNSYLRFDRFESSAMDMTWIKEIEDCIPDLNEIVSNPKRTIQTLSEVVEVEKVKKTSHESVQHLASHSQFVKSIDEDGNVTPSKILNVYNDDFFAIYENKFVATLLRRLFIFVEKRYDYIIHQATLKDVELLYFKNKTEIDGSEIEIETKIRYSKPALDEADEKLKEMIRRINDIRRYLRFFGNSEFMRILHRERDVRNPILQTNIIRKNPKYRHCYQLWQFINSYNESGVEIKVEENYAKLTEEDLKDINKVLMMNFLALKGRDAPKVESKPKIFRPRILKTYDDEIYNPGASFDAPVEFIRVDEKYRQYMDTLKDLNPHPTRAYQEYMKEEYADNKFRREETAQVDSLLKRKENELKKYEKKQEKLLQKEQEDWEMINDLAEQQIQEEQEERLRPIREMLGIRGNDDETRINDAISTEGHIQELIEDSPLEKSVVQPEDDEGLPVTQVAEKAPEQTPIEEQPQPEELVQEEPANETETVEEEVQSEPEPEQPQEPVKKKRGGARPGAGRPRKVVEQPAEEPVSESESQPEPEPIEEVKEPVVEETPVQEEQPIEEPVKKKRGGARPGAGRPRKIRPEPKVEEPVIEPEPEPQPEPVAEEQPVKKQRGGWRPGAGRKPKNRDVPQMEEVSEPEPIIVHKQRGGARPGAGRKPKPLSERPVKGQWGGARPGAGRKPKPKSDELVIKKQRGGARPGAGRKPKPHPEEQPQPVAEEAKPTPQPKPVSRKAKKAAKIAERKERRAKILNKNNSRTGKKLKRR